MSVTAITPPLPEEQLQFVNVIPEIEREVERDVNSNIVPFPLNRVMFSNVTSLQKRLPLPMSISGLSFVPYFELPPLMITEFRITLPPPLTYTRLYPLPIFFFNTTLNPLMFNIPVERVKTFDEEENDEGTSNSTSPLLLIGSVFFPTLIVVLSFVCVPSINVTQTNALFAKYELSIDSLMDEHGDALTPHDTDADVTLGSM